MELHCPLEEQQQRDRVMDYPDRRMIFGPDEGQQQRDGVMDYPDRRMIFGPDEGHSQIHSCDDKISNKAKWDLSQFYVGSRRPRGRSKRMHDMEYYCGARKSCSEAPGQAKSNHNTVRCEPSGNNRCASPSEGEWSEPNRLQTSAPQCRIKNSELSGIERSASSDEIEWSESGSFQRGAPQSRNKNRALSGIDGSAPSCWIEKYASPCSASRIACVSRTERCAQTGDIETCAPPSESAHHHMFSSQDALYDKWKRTPRNRCPLMHSEVVHIPTDHWEYGQHVGIGNRDSAASDAGTKLPHNRVHGPIVDQYGSGRSVSMALPGVRELRERCRLLLAQLQQFAGHSHAQTVFQSSSPNADYLATCYDDMGSTLEESHGPGYNDLGENKVTWYNDLGARTYLGPAGDDVGLLDTSRCYVNDTFTCGGYVDGVCSDKYHGFVIGRHGQPLDSIRLERSRDNQLRVLNTEDKILNQLMNGSISASSDPSNQLLHSNLAGMGSFRNRSRLNFSNCGGNSCLDQQITAKVSQQPDTCGKRIENRDNLDLLESGNCYDSDRTPFGSCSIGVGGVEQYVHSRTAPHRSRHLVYSDHTGGALAGLSRCRALLHEFQLHQGQPDPKCDQYKP